MRKFNSRHGFGRNCRNDILRFNNFTVFRGFLLTTTQNGIIKCTNGYKTSND